MVASWEARPHGTLADGAEAVLQVRQIETGVGARPRERERKREREREREREKCWCWVISFFLPI